jgi:small subunit ribosomal protein S4
MVVHGHILVDGKKAAIPSHIVEVGQKISVKDKSKKSSLFDGFEERVAEQSVPTWMTFNNKKMEASIKSEPSKDNTEIMYDLGVVLEFYSR